MLNAISSLQATQISRGHGYLCTRSKCGTIRVFFLFSLSFFLLLFFAATLWKCGPIVAAALRKNRLRLRHFVYGISFTALFSHVLSVKWPSRRRMLHARVFPVPHKLWKVKRNTSFLEGGNFQTVPVCAQARSFGMVSIRFARFLVPSDLPFPAYPCDVVDGLRCDFEN